MRSHVCAEEGQLNGHRPAASLSSMFLINFEQMEYSYTNCCNILVC